MPIEPARPADPAEASPDRDALTRRERYFFDLYRVFEAAALTALTVSPLADRLVTFASPVAARSGALAYFTGALLIFAASRLLAAHARPLVLLGLLVDVLAAVTALIAIDGFENQIATLLLVNVSCGALLLPARVALPFALLAGLAVTAAFGLTGVGDASVAAWTSGALFALTYFAAAVLCALMRRNVSESQRLVEQREIDLANLTQLNDLIIRRMRTGVIVVDSANQVHRINESAWHLLGNPSPNRRELGDIAPELSRRLYHWRTSGRSESAPVALSEGVPEVIPRFVKLAQGDEQNVLIFLDDISLLSRQAEQLTLSSLGRLSASIAHEVRNPLTAISYSAQLLAESEDLPEPDQRLVDIIRLQCSRMNAIVENILQLSRRERSRPEQLDLGQWAQSFVDEYRSMQPLGQDDLRAIANVRAVTSLADPSHLQQIVWNLVQNALRYGRLPHEPARVSVVARRLEGGQPVLEVVDRGPGIPKRVADQIFDPFFTTHEHGTGLGLYIARQLCEANQATLEYVPVAGGGSCFRIVLPNATAMTTPVPASRARAPSA